MMESALAASVLKLESHVPDKSGGKATKAEGAGKKAAFAEALKQHHPGKPGTTLKDTEGKVEATADDADVLPLPDDMPDMPAADAKPEPAAPLRLKRAPEFLAARTPSPDGETAEPDATVDDRKGPQARIEAKIAEAKLNAGRTILRDQPAVDETGPGAKTDAGAELTRLDDGAAPVKRPMPKRAAPADDDTATERPATTDASAKHALGMLDDRSARIDTRSATPSSASHDASAPMDGQDDAGATSSPGYRISRADGKGGVLEIPGRVRGESQEKQPVTNFNQVTVLDQRRYLAPAQDNALSVVQSLTAEPEWVSAMQPDQALANAAAVAGGGKVVNTLKIQMHPIELGLVNATLRLHGDELSVELKVETGTAYRQLKEDHNRMIDALKAQGFNVDKITIVMAPERMDPGAGAGQQPGGQSANGQAPGFAQQQSRDSGQGANMGQERRNFGQERAANGGNADESRTEGVGAPVAGGRRPGHVYL